MNIFEKVANNTIDLAFSVWPRRRPSQDQLKQAKVIAHRGVREDGSCKENTLNAFRLAHENGLHGVEFDIRFTKDEVPIVLHDSSTGRVFGNPDYAIEELDVGKLKELCPELPTLAETVKTFGGKIHLFMEIKNDLREKPRHMRNVLRELAGLNPGHHFHLMSLEPEYLEAFNDIPKSSFIDIIWLSPKRILDLNRRLGHGGVAGHYLFIKDSDIARLHNEGKKAGVGFLSSRNSLYREIHRGADWIFTDHPLRLKRILTDTA